MKQSDKDIINHAIKQLASPTRPVDSAAVEAARKWIPHADLSPIMRDGLARIITDAYAEKIRKLRDDVNIGCRWITAFDKIAVAAGFSESWVEANPEHAGEKVIARLTHEREVREQLVAAQTMGVQVNTPDFLDWMADRLINVYKESPNVDFVHSLRDRATAGRTALAAAAALEGEDAG